MKCARRCSSRSAACSSDRRARLGRRSAPVLEAVARGRDRRIRPRSGVASAMLPAAACSARRRSAETSSLQRRAIAEFDAARIFPLRLDRDRAAAGCSDARALSALPMMSAGRRSSVRHRHRFVGGERHEGRIGAVLQQPPHQIGQQIAMAADRRVGATGDVGAIFAAVARTAPRPCRAGAGIRIRSSPSASSRMVATVSALWVANCGKIRGRSASSCCAQAT